MVIYYAVCAHFKFVCFGGFEANSFKKFWVFSISFLSQLVYIYLNIFCWISPLLYWELFKEGITQFNSNFVKNILSIL